MQGAGSAGDARTFAEQRKTRNVAEIDLRLYVKMMRSPFLGWKLNEITQKFTEQGYRYADIINAWWILIGRQEIVREKDGWWRTS